MGPQTIPNDLKSTKEIAGQLGVSVHTIRRWVNAGRLPGFRIGGRLRVSLQDALALIQQVEPTTGPQPETRADRDRREAEVDSVLRKMKVRR